MQRVLKLEEFFENTKDNVLQNLRSNAIASLFVFSGNIEYQGNQADLLKKLFLLYKKKNFFASCPRLLIGIKGINYFENSNFESVESAFFEILKEMRAGVEALRRGETHVVGVHRVGHDQLIMIAEFHPVGQVVGIAVSDISKLSGLGCKTNCVV